MPRPKKFKFYLDENFPSPVGWYLSSLGHTILYANKAAGKEGDSDYNQIRKSTKERAIFLTIDRDFVIDGDLKRWANESYGVVLFHATDSKPKTIRILADKVIKYISKQAPKGKICVASKEKIKYVSK